MKAVGKKEYGIRRQPANHKVFEGKYLKFLKYVPTVAKHLRNRYPDVEVVNATPGSALIEWPIVDPGKVL